MKYEVIVTGERRLKAEFDKVKDIIEDVRPEWKEVRPVFYKIELEQFASEGSKGKSGKWKALSPGYAKYKRIRFGAKPILRATDALWKSLTGTTPDSIVKEEKLEFAHGTKLPRGKKHQTGIEGKLARRKPIDLTKKDEEKLFKAFKGSLLKRVKRTKFKVS